MVVMEQESDGTVRGCRGPGDLSAPPTACGRLCPRPGERVTGGPGRQRNAGKNPGAGESQEVPAEPDNQRSTEVDSVERQRP